MLQQVSSWVASNYRDPKVILLAGIGTYVTTRLLFKKVMARKDKHEGRLTVIKPKKDFVYLFVFPGEEQYSPYCIKLEAYLKMVKIPYELRPGRNNNSPTYKLPYIEFNNQLFYDSSLIIDMLKQKFGDPLDNHLSVVEKATALAWKRLLENSFYWNLLWARWIDDFGWTGAKQLLSTMLPAPLKYFLPNIIRNQTRKVLIGMGTGRLTKDEIIQLTKEDLDALSVFLGNKKYLMGDKISSVDCVVYGFITVLVDTSMAITITEYSKTIKNLVDYQRRIKAEYYK